MRNSAICIIILALATALYYPAIGHPFVDYDDGLYVTVNPHIRAGITSSTVHWAFVATETGNWHPLTWMSHALDAEFFGLEPPGHHFTSVAIHALNSAILFLIAFYATKREGPSLVLALLFALHPMNVESVAWIAELKNVLSTLFFLLAVAAYGWYVRKPQWIRYLAVVIFFACSLMSKPMLVTFPFILLLLDYWPLQRFDGTNTPALTLEKFPLFLLSGVSCLITLHAQLLGHAFRSTSAHLPMALRVSNAILSYALYLWKTVWPVRLAVFYPHPGSSISPGRVAFAGFVLAAITGVCFVLRRRKYLVTGWLWFLGTLVPVIGIVQVGDQGMADRYGYIPLIGLFLIITWSAADFFDSKQTPAPVRATLATAVLLALSITTFRQIGYWSSTTELWSHTLAVTTNNPFAHRHLGWAFMTAGQNDEALSHFREAVAISPTDAANYINLGLCLQQSYQPRAALEQYQEAVSLSSDPQELAAAYTNAGAIYDGAGDYPDAYESYSRAVRLDPELFNAYLNRGLVLEREGNVEAAVTDFQRSVEVQPTVRGYLELGRALHLLNRSREAEVAEEKAGQLQSASDVGR